MAARVRPTIALCILLGAPLAGCATDSQSVGGGSGGSGNGGGRGSGGATSNPHVPERETSVVDHVDRTYAPIFQAVYDEVLVPSCADLFCHNDGDGYFDALTIDIAYATLVNAKTDSIDCGALGLLRVKPYEPQQSLLYLKLTDPPCGLKMPRTYDGYIDPRQVEQVRQWIELGAERYGADE